jgi:hypothetical protein
MLTEAQRRRLEELYAKVERNRFRAKSEEWARQRLYPLPSPLTEAEKVEFRQLHLVLWDKTNKEGKNV